MFRYIFMFLLLLLSFSRGESILHPEINFVFDFSYVNRDIPDSKYENLEIPGFLHKVLHVDEHSDVVINQNEGFNLNYGELSFSFEPDSSIHIYGIFHLTENSFEIGELYFLTKNNYLQIKGGKFRSSIGIINRQHQHQWDFSDIPLVYQVFFGYHSLNEKGIQLSFPVNYSLLFGTEILQGENEYSFGGKSDKKPDLFTVFIEHFYRLNNFSFSSVLSFLKGKSFSEHLEDSLYYQFSGNTEIYGFGLKSVYYLNRGRSISIQGEYFYRNMNGDEYTQDLVYAVDKKQAGFYLQTVLYLSEKWDIAFRYDFLNENRTNMENLPSNLYRYSMAVGYRFSKLSKLRLQYNYDCSKFIEDKRKKINEFIIELNFEFGFAGEEHHHEQFKHFSND